MEKKYNFVVKLMIHNAKPMPHKYKLKNIDNTEVHNTVAM